MGGDGLWFVAVLKQTMQQQQHQGFWQGSELLQWKCLAGAGFEQHPLFLL